MRAAAALKGRILLGNCSKAIQNDECSSRRDPDAVLGLLHGKDSTVIKRLDTLSLYPGCAWGQRYRETLGRCWQ